MAGLPLRRRFGYLALVAVAVWGLASCAREGSRNQSETPGTASIAAPETTNASLPEPVARTRQAILAAASAGDLAGLGKLLRPESRGGFNYTFGPAFEGGAVAYWQDEEDKGLGHPLADLQRILQLPPARVDTLYVWPYLFSRDLNTLSDEELHQLRQLEGGLSLVGMVDSEGNYLGPRTAITDRGEWIYFVSGD